MLNKIRELNPQMSITPVSSDSFKKYGRVINEYNFSPLIEYAVLHTEIPDQGNIYVANDTGMQELEITAELTESFFGEMPIQIGYCNGRNVKLNALEYHKSSEINVAVTDSILLVASITDMEDRKIDSRKVEAFYIRKGEAVELYSTTFHFSPCAVEETGFKMLVILPEGTNLPLVSQVKRDPMLWKRNKWLLIHPEAEHLKRGGALEGIAGENIEIRL